LRLPGIYEDTHAGAFRCRDKSNRWRGVPVAGSPRAFCLPGARQRRKSRRRAGQEIILGLLAYCTGAPVGQPPDGSKLPGHGLSRSCSPVRWYQLRFVAIAVIDVAWILDLGSWRAGLASSALVIVSHCSWEQWDNSANVKSGCNKRTV